MSAFTSALYVGDVRHRRRRPVTNAFRYRTYHVFIDVDELPRLDRELRGFGHNRPALTGFYDADHFGPGDEPVRDELSRLLAAHGYALPDGPLRVLTDLRVLGYVFAPVSWWFCHRADGSIALVVAEVHNTFGEVHCYVLTDLRPAGGPSLRARADKSFHVSPFLPVDGLAYGFTLVPPGHRVLAHVDVHDERGKLFDATQRGRRVPLTSARLAWTLLLHPLTTLRTVALIHWQALRLWRKGVPFHRKPPPPSGLVSRPVSEQEVGR